MRQRHPFHPWVEMKILYATDGLDPAAAAADLVVRLADPEKVEVTVVSVTPRGLPDLQHAVLLMDPPEERREDSHELVDYWTAHFASAGFRVEGRAAEGRPGPEIVRLIGEEGAEIAVMGSGRHSWLGQKILGSVSTHVLHASETSVLIVHEAPPKRSEKRILVAVDGSDGSSTATQVVTDLVSPNRCTVRVITCFAPVTATMVPGAIGLPYIPSGIQYEDAAQAAQRTAEATAVAFRRAGYTATSTASYGQPVEQILKEAASFSADLIAVGSRGLGGLSRAVLGSVSDQLVRHPPATLVARRAG